MPNNFKELAIMLAKRDGISVNEELEIINNVAMDMEAAFYKGDLDDTIKYSLDN